MLYIFVVLTLIIQRLSVINGRNHYCEVISACNGMPHLACLEPKHAEIKSSHLRLTEESIDVVMRAFNTVRKSIMEEQNINNMRIMNWDFDLQMLSMSSSEASDKLYCNKLNDGYELLELSYSLGATEVNRLNTLTYLSNGFMKTFRTSMFADVSANAIGCSIAFSADKKTITIKCLVRRKITTTPLIGPKCGNCGVWNESCNYIYDYRGLCGQLKSNRYSENAELLPNSADFFKLDFTINSQPNATLAARFSTLNMYITTNPVPALIAILLIFVLIGTVVMQMKSLLCTFYQPFVSMFCLCNCLFNKKIENTQDKPTPLAEYTKIEVTKKTDEEYLKKMDDPKAETV